MDTFGAFGQLVRGHVGGGESMSDELQVDPTELELTASRVQAVTPDLRLLSSHVQDVANGGDVLGNRDVTQAFHTFGSSWSVTFGSYADTVEAIGKAVAKAAHDYRGADEANAATLR